MEPFTTIGSWRADGAHPRYPPIGVGLHPQRGDVADVHRKHLTRIGDQWTFVALDPDTKLVPSYLVGKRTRDNAVARDFIRNSGVAIDSITGPPRP